MGMVQPGMATPGDLGVFGTALGSGIEAAARKQQQLAQNASLEWNASVADRDAEVYEKLARNAQQAGENEAAETRLAYNSLRGSQRAGYAAAGIDVNYGTAADVQTSTVAWGEYEAQKAIYNGSMQAFEYRTQSINRQMEAVSARASVQKPNMAAYIIGGVNNTLGSWMSGVNSIVSRQD